MKMKSIKDWSASVPSVSPSLKAWLLYQGSFMTRLKEHGIIDAKVQVLNESRRIPEEWERVCLGIAREETLVREVLILNATQCFMFARTVIPESMLSGALEELSQLGNRSLGSVLFNHPYVRREEFEFTIVTFSSCEDSHLPARRSIFTLQEKKLLLTEVFFKDATIYV